MSEVPTCNVCGGTAAVEAVTVSWQGRTFIVDLCEREKVTLGKWEQAGSTQPRARASRHVKPPSHSVTPID